MTLKKTSFIFILCLSSLLSDVHAQLGVKYDASAQQSGNMQYFRPKGNLFVGDCIPFYKDKTLYYYWLLDSAHHKSLGGLGGHQWVLSTSKDLKNWKQYPIVLGIDESWEKSICTGSVVFYKNTFYAFYATRLIDDHGKVNEQLSYAISKDGVHFSKQKPNPFYTSAPGYSKRNFRDPKVFVDKDGVFHLFVSSSQEDPILKNESGCLVHLTSSDLKTWKVLEPIITGQGSVPECPDYFSWNGWYYLVYSDGSNTFYLKSKNAFGPWEQPKSQAFNEDFSNVVKTAEFVGNRRLAIGWIPARLGDTDEGHEIFGGNSIFREIIQESDGTLDTRFPPEMLPPIGKTLDVKFTGSTGKIVQRSTLHLLSANGIDALQGRDIPKNCRISFTIDPQGPNEEFGLYLRSSDKASSGYKLSFSALDQIVSLHNTSIKAVTGMDHRFNVDIIMKGDIIDVCIDGKRCIVNRLGDQKGDSLWFYIKHGKAEIAGLRVQEL